MKIGIMGGSFNPIHLGHLMMSEYLREELQLDKVLFIPTGKAPHKSYFEANEWERLKMVQMAVESNDFFEVSDIEVKNEEVSYSVDTLKKLILLYPKAEFYFFLGSDILLDLKGWKRFDELARLCKFACAVRPGFEKVSIEVMKSEISYLKEKFEAEIYIVETPRYEISSTDLRNRLEENKSVKYLIPEKVYSYVKEKNLYGESKN